MRSKYLLSTMLIMLASTMLFNAFLFNSREQAELQNPVPIFYVPFEGNVDPQICASGTQWKYNGNQSIDDGIRGKALRKPADSVNFSLNYSEAGNLNPQQGTIEFWVRPNWEFWVGPNSMYFQEAMETEMISPLRPPIEIYHGWFGISTGDLYNHSDPKLYKPYSTYTTTWNKGEWHQIVFTWNHSLGTRLYIDGSYRSYTPGGFVTLFYNNITWVPSPYDYFLVGCNKNGGQLANADIDEFKIYDVPLDEDTVEAHYRAMFPVEFYAKETVFYTNLLGQQVNVEINNTGTSTIQGWFSCRVRGGSETSMWKELAPSAILTITVPFGAEDPGEYYLDCYFSETPSSDVLPIYWRIKRTIRLFAISPERVPSATSLTLNPIVSIDCTDVLTTPDSSNWTAILSVPNSFFGRGVASGDINGDGYSDVIIGAPIYHNGGKPHGAVFVYYGSATGLSDTWDWKVVSDQEDSFFGFSVASGDVNGDGCDDVIIGASRYLVGQAIDGKRQGAVFVYYGNPSGPSTTWDWKVEGPYQEQEDVGFGISVAAGDVNGDGFDDVIIGQCFYDGTLIGFSNKEEAVYVYYGSLAGPSTTPGGPNEPSYKPDWNVTKGNLAGYDYQSGFGFSVAAADVHDDGFDDVIIGHPYYTDDHGGEGAVFAYNGSANGPSTTPGGPNEPSYKPDWSAWSNQGVVSGSGSCAIFGFSVACAGDVNGDGYDDLIIGSNHYQIEGKNRGAAFLYYGSMNGLTKQHTGGQDDPYPDPDWVGAVDVGRPGQVDPEVGACVAGVGDLNNDGFDDVIIGAHWYDYGEVDEGCAFVFYGSSAGLPAAPNWVIGANKTEACLGLCLASAGDVNGDGYSDILVGVYRKESAFVWYGGQVVPARPYFETEGTRIVWGTQPVALYKETGDKWGSRFGYRFKVDKLRQPHVVVVTYPDDEKRTMEIDLFSTAQTALFPDTQTGVFTGEVYPCTNNFKEHKMIFWPQGEDCLITIVNRLNGSRAAARKIEVYEIEGSEATGWLPETHVNLPQDGGRLLGLWWEDPSFFECFGSQNCRNYTEFYRAVRNAMEYLHYTGQNLIIYPIYFYTMPHYPSRVEDCLSSRRTVFQHPREDWFELLLKVAKVNDVFVIPSLTINEIPSLMKMYVDNPVNRRGEPTKKAILNIVDDILGEYGHYPAFKGISFNFWDTALLWRCYGMENTDRGGIHEANHLLNEITQKIQSWRDDLKLVVSCWLPYPHLDDNFDTFWDLDRWCACAGPKEDEIYSLYEEAGLNLAQLKLQDQGIEIERVLSFSAFRQTDSAGQEIPGTSCIRDFFLHESCYEPFFKTNNIAAAIYNGYFESWEGQFPAYTYRCGYGWSYYWWEKETSGGLHRHAAITPSDKYFMENYMLVMTNLDPIQIGNGGLTVGTVGHEEQIQEFAKAFRALPAKSFDIGWNLDKVRVRHLTIMESSPVDGIRKYYFYLMNKKSYKVQVDLTFNTQSFELIDLVSGEVIPVVNWQYQKELNPYELRSYLIVHPTAYITQVTTPTNIVITDITSSKSNPVVNETIQIYVTIENQGNNTETFYISVNYTRIYDPSIGTRTITLAPGELIKLNFTWTPTTSGRYEIIAYTSTIPDDINPSDNTKTITVSVTSTSEGGSRAGQRAIW